MEFTILQSMQTYVSLLLYTSADRSFQAVPTCTPTLITSHGIVTNLITWVTQTLIDICITVIKKYKSNNSVSLTTNPYLCMYSYCLQVNIHLDKSRNSLPQCCCNSENNLHCWMCYTHSYLCPDTKIYTVCSLVYSYTTE